MISTRPMLLIMYHERWMSALKDQAQSHALYIRLARFIDSNQSLVRPPGESRAAYIFVRLDSPFRRQVRAGLWQSVRGVLAIDFAYILS